MHNPPTHTPRQLNTLSLISPITYCSTAASVSSGKERWLAPKSEQLCLQLTAPVLINRRSWTCATAPTSHSLQLTLALTIRSPLTPTGVNWYSPALWFGGWYRWGDGTLPLSEPENLYFRAGQLLLWLKQWIWTTTTQVIENWATNAKVMGLIPM